MITTKNLEKAGFIPGEWEDLDPGDKYRTYRLEISEKTAIEVDEVVIKGVTKFEALCLVIGGEYRSLNINSVTQILELKKLLK